MNALELLGFLWVILGVIGMVVMQKGKWPTYRSTSEPTKSNRRSELGATVFLF